MQITSSQFKKVAHIALKDETLQRALKNIKRGFVAKRAAALERLPEFNQIRDHAVEIKNHTLHYLDYYLETFEEQVIQSGGTVHWASTAEEASQKIVTICQAVNARSITKSKSMMTEEIELNTALEKAGLLVTETDLGEYIIQLRKERPSHIVAPVIHLVKEQVAEAFYKNHLDLDPHRSLDQRETLLNEARTILRQKFLQADVGITGANFFIAETGTTVIITNEGNGDLTQILPKVHIVVTSIEKVLPTLEDGMQILRLLPRSATGQEISTYTTFSTGPKRYSDLDGPEQFHVVLVDNGRSQLLGGKFHEILRCIRCGACLNHCPVYDSIGGHPYGSIYPGPMGAVLTPSLFGIKASVDLPNASTLCGRCETVCPMRIPLPTLIRQYREEAFEKHVITKKSRFALFAWSFFAKRPRVYHGCVNIVAKLLHCFAGRQGRFHSFWLSREWTKYRDFPAPAKKTFHQQWVRNHNDDA